MEPMTGAIEMTAGPAENLRIDRSKSFPPTVTRVLREYDRLVFNQLWLCNPGSTPVSAMANRWGESGSRC